MVSAAADSERLLRDLDFLSDVTRETLSSLQLNTLLWRVVGLMRDRFGYDYAAVALVEEEWVRFHAGAGGDLDHVFEEERNWRVPVGQGIVGTTVASGKPHLANDVTTDPAYIRLEFLARTRSELAVPLIHHDKVLGVLDVQSNAPGAFGETDQRLLEIVAALVAPAIHIASLYDRWRRRTRYLHLLGEISRMVMSSLTEDNVIQVACDAILEALDISFAGIGLVSPEARCVVHAGHATRAQLQQPAGFGVPIGEGVVGKVAETGEAILIDDTQSFPGFVEVVPGMRSALAVPMRVRDRVLGVLDVEHYRPHHFTDEDQRLLENLAAYLSQALENAQLFDTQRRRWQQLLVINEAARIATEPLDLGEILVQVAREVHDRFGYFAVAVGLCDEREVEVRAVRCDEELEIKAGQRQRLGCGALGLVAQNGEVLEIGPDHPAHRESALRHDIRSILCVPLRSQNRVVGAIEVQSLEARAFGPEDRLVMETLAKSVSGAIANARAIQRTEQLREDLNRMIVHDLRNPVQAVLLTLQEVQRAAEGQLPEKTIDSVREGIACTEDILGMVSSLLDVARFEAGKVQLRKAPAAINDHVRAEVRRCAPIARSKRIQITTVLSQEVPVVWVDHDLVNRAIANLVSNALKFTPEGARVTIRTELVGERRADCALAPPFVVLTVQDTGEGIPEAYYDKIFEKFGQVESRKAGLKMSTGLGLALCRYVVQAHGGQIWVESRLGKGSTFYVAFPAER